MTREEALRAFAARDWSAVQEEKRAAWLDRRRREGAAAGLVVADELRRQVHAVRPGWPTPADREEDLARHQKVAERLARASASRKP